MVANATSPSAMKLDWRSTSPRPPKSSENPSTSRRLPITEPRERAADDLGQALVHGQQRDDQLGRVAEGGVEEAADARARVLGGVLRRLADQPRQRDERECGEDELDRLVEVERVVDQDDDRRERDRGEEHAANHGPPTLSRRLCGTPHCLKTPEMSSLAAGTGGTHNQV